VRINLARIYEPAQLSDPFAVIRNILLLDLRHDDSTLAERSNTSHQQGSQNHNKTSKFRTRAEWGGPIDLPQYPIHI
jgi:hypothetical protein